MELIELITIYLEQQKHSIKQRTYLFYQKIAEIYIKNVSITIEKLSNEFLNNLILQRKEKLSYSSIKIIKSLINRSLQYAYEKNIIKEKLCIGIKLKQQGVKKVDSLTKLEQQKLEKHIIANKKIYCYGILISLYTGLRIGELLSLKWQDIDFEDKIIKVQSSSCQVLKNHKLIDIEDLPKTQSSVRQLPVTNFLIKLLKELKSYQNNLCEYVLSNTNNKKISVRTYQQSFNRLLQRLKIKHYGFHSLRHTFATRLLENKVDIKTISELMGHSSPTITLNRYVHTNLENKRKALQTLIKKIAFYQD